ncbi:hypothetical protein DL96DRAFT_1616827 [Flagelloscypha sp. PMI_526]|nr:hypothetical protein DL96DRAFT_1616827 [Flagelloscypha sp. PMI_526]
MRGPFSLIPAYPKRALVVLYTVMIMIPFTWIYLSNPHPWPVLMADHPEIDLSQVPRWYGWGAWFAVRAVLFTMVLPCARDRMVGHLCVLAFGCYSLLSSWDLYIKSQALVDQQGHVDYTILAPCAAANIAVSFCSGFLQVEAVTLLSSWIGAASKPSRLAIAKLIFVLTISLIPVLVIWPHKGGIRAWKCNEDDDKCKQAHQKVQSLVFFGQTLSEAIGDLKDVAYSMYSAMYPIRITGNFDKDIMLIIPGLASLGVMNLVLWLSQLGWKQRLPLAVFASIFSFWVSPLFILWIAPRSIFVLFVYPLLCMLLHIPVYLTVGIRGYIIDSATRISVRETDQMIAFIASGLLFVTSFIAQFVLSNPEKSKDEEAESLPQYMEGPKESKIQTSS